jgi:hypothetical protein
MMLTHPTAFRRDDHRLSHFQRPRRREGSVAAMAGKKDLSAKTFFFVSFFLLSVSSFRCRGWRAPWTPIEGEAPVAEPSPTPSTLPVTPGAKDAQHLSLIFSVFSFFLSVLDFSISIFHSKSLFVCIQSAILLCYLNFLFDIVSLCRFLFIILYFYP